jgi:hypothetical protein
MTEGQIEPGLTENAQSAEKDAAAVAILAVPAWPEPAPEPKRRYPLRFVWQIDAAGCFSIGSDEFIALVGADTATALGRSWQEVAATLDLDPDARLGRALATHETWSGLLVAWPVDDSTERLTVELSGLPIFDRDRSFRGYRGFGVCRDVARLAALARSRLGASAEPLAAGTEEPYGETRVAENGGSFPESDRAARLPRARPHAHRTIEQGQAR